MFITLKPQGQRNVTADQVIARLSKALQQVQGITLYMQAAQDINIGAMRVEDAVPVHADRRGQPGAEPVCAATAAEAAGAAATDLGRQRPAERRADDEPSRSTAPRRRASASTRRGSTPPSTTRSAAATWRKHLHHAEPVLRHHGGATRRSSSGRTRCSGSTCSRRAAPRCR